MKLLVALVLLGSLTLNAVWWTRTDTLPPSAPAPVAMDSNLPEQPSRTAQAHSTETVSPSNAIPLKWAELPAGDLQALAKALNDLGVPAHVVRGIAAYYLAQEYRAKREELNARMGAYRYWENTMYAGPDQAALRAEMRNLAREQNERLNALAGTSDHFFDPISLVYMRQRYGNLPPDKVTQLQAIEADYSELTNQIRQASQGLTLPEDREALALLETERRKDFAAILTPEELEEFDLRASNTAQQLRRNLDAMQPTEEEFRLIHGLQRAFDEKYSSNSVGRNSRAFVTERQAAERDMVAAVKAALGPERGSEYEKSRDYAYVHAHSVAKGLGLPKDTGDRLWNLQRDAFQQFNRVGNDSALAPTERRQRQLEYVQSLRTAIAAEIGAENLPSYEQGGGGWLRSLEMSANRAINRASPPPPTAR
jgi:hypothetical protein